MYYRVPKKNISKKVIDIKRPFLKKPKNEDYLPPPTPKRPSKIKRILKIFLLIFGIIAILIAVNLFIFRKNLINSYRYIYEETLKAKQAAQNLDIKDVSKSLKNINNEINSVGSQISGLSLKSIATLFNKLVPALEQVPKSIQNFSFLSVKTLAISEDLNELQNNGFQLINSGRGNELIAILDRLENNITAIQNLNAEIRTQTIELGDLTPEFASLAEIIKKNYIPLNSNLYRLGNLIKALSSILKSPGDQHILFIFQNPSEIRPAGGFIGSFGDLILNNGNLKEIKIDDIYNADRQLNLKVIPPKELQKITRDWGARDSNWFFDFPASAKKVIYFLENSKLFSDNSVKFQGVIAINTNVLNTILDSVGPIEVPSYGLTISSKNFLEEIQREVEAGRDKKPGQNPKKILSALTPILLEKFASLNNERKNILFEQLNNHLKQKDVMLYFNDWRMEDFFIGSGIAGESFDLPKDFSGDYLAVVNANIAGGKTDAFVSQKIILKSKISNEGKIANQLAITRSHNGKNESDWWYKVENKNYLKFFVPAGSKILALRGNTPPPEYGKLVKKYSGSSFDYDKNSYKYDLNLLAIEKTASFNSQLMVWTSQEAGKKFFGTWFNLPAGETETLEAIYESNKEIFIGDGQKYQFIFEKQSGVNSPLEYSVAAPEGFVWKESNAQVFEFKSDQPKAREIIELTLQKTP